MSSEPRWFIPDVPEVDPMHDAFGHSDVADNLLTMIRGSRSERLMIGLLGEFGVGKSTVIELLTASLRGDSTVNVVRLSAERHLPLVFHRSLVYAFAEALVQQNLIPTKLAESSIQELEQSTARVERDFSRSPAARITRSIIGTGAWKVLKVFGWWLLGALGVLAVGATIAAARGFDVLDLITSGYGNVVLWLSLIGPTVQSLFGAVKLDKFFESEPKTTTKPRVEAADEHERMFATLAEAVKGRLVIAIDDIDRLSPAEVLVSLNAIRGFQLTCTRGRQPIFIVSADERVVRSALNGAGITRSDSKEEAADALSAAYLNRLFTQRQSMPQHAHIDLRDYAESVLKREPHDGAEAVGEDIHDVLTILIHDRVSDPRHVIRILNTFFGDYRLAMRREQRSGKRSIRKGEVTGHVRVLARLTVFKTDFPDFYEQLRQDTDLLELLDRKSRILGPDEKDEELLTRAKIDSSTPEAKQLLAFASRTSGWVEEVSNLLPFIYLGQDRLDRALGSREAREARGFLLNAQGVALADLIGQAVVSADEERLSTLVDLIVETLRDANGMESENAIGAIVDASPAIPAEHRAAIADSTIAALRRSPNAPVDIAALIDLASSASQPHMAETVASKLLEPLPSTEVVERGFELLQKRAAATHFVGPERMAAQLQFAINHLAGAGQLDDFDEWIEEVVEGRHHDLRGALAGAVIDVSSRTGEEVPKGWGSKALTVFDEVPSTQVDALVGVAIKAFRAGVSGEAGRISTGGTSRLKFSQAKMHADLVVALRNGMLDSSGNLETGIEDESLDSLVQLLTNGVREAHNYTAEKISIVDFAVTTVAAVIKRGGHMPAGVGDFYSTALTHRASSITPLFSAMFDRWISEDDGEVNSAVNLSTIGAIVANLETLPQTVFASFKASYLPLLNPDSIHETQPVAEHYLGRVLEVGGLSFALEVVQQLTLFIRYNTPVEAKHVQASLVLAFERESISEPHATALLSNSAQMLQYGGAAAEVGMALLTSIQWPQEILARVLDELAPFAASIDEEHAQLLVTHLTGLKKPIPPTLMEKFLSGLRGAANSSIKARQDAAANSLHLAAVDEAVPVAIRLANGPSRLAEILTAKDDSERSASYSLALVSVAEGIDSREISLEEARPLMKALYVASPGDYVGAIDELVSKQLGGDAYFESDAWAAILEPYGEEQAMSFGKTVAESWAGAASDVERSASLVGGGLHNQAIATFLAPLGAEAIRRWVHSENNALVAGQLAAGLRVTAETRAAALQAIGPRGPRKNSPARGAFETAQAKLKTA